MITRVSPAGFVGRAIAAVGAVVMIVSLFQPAFENDPISAWDLYSKLDIVVLVSAVATILLLLVSLFAGAEILLYAVSVIASFVLGFFLLVYLEFPGNGTGWYLAIVGSAASLVGAAIALVPALIARAGNQPTLHSFPPSRPLRMERSRPDGTPIPLDRPGCGTGMGRFGPNAQSRQVRI